MLAKHLTMLNTVRENISDIVLHHSLKMDSEIRCDKMTEAILINPSEKKLH